jgi:hypothetical protein
MLNMNEFRIIDLVGNSSSLFSSLSCDNGVLLNGHVGADPAEEGWLVRLGLKSPNSLTKRKRKSVVIGLNLAGCNGGLLTDCSNSGIL